MPDAIRPLGENVGEWYYKKFLDSRFPDDVFNFTKVTVPYDIKKLMKYCKVLYLTDPLLAPAVNAMSEYPITELIYETEDTGLKRQWREIMEEKIMIYDVLIRAANYLLVQGNGFLTFYDYHQRMLSCRKCHTDFPFSKVRDIRFVTEATVKFKGTCPKCKYQGAFRVIDIAKPNWDRSKVVFWEPVDMHIYHNPITDSSIYTYTPPAYVKQDLLQRIDFLEDTPAIYLQAVGSSKSVEFKRGQVFHLRNRIWDRGWGFPYILPSLPLIFYIRVLRRANQEIAFNYVFPIRILFPQPTANVDPVQQISMEKWKTSVDRELKIWYRNPSHIIKMPIPIGYESLGGEAKALNFIGEIEAASRQAIGALGIPIELLTGPMTWSGSSVALRNLQTHFKNIRIYHQRILNWVVEKVARSVSIKPITIKMTELKLIDDLARKQFWFQLWQQNALSLDTLLDNIGIDKPEEDSKIMQEAKDKIKRDSELQAYAQDEQEKMENKSGGNIFVKAEKLIQGVQAQLKEQPWERQKQYMEQIKTQMPELYKALTHGEQDGKLPPRGEPQQ